MRNLYSLEDFFLTSRNVLKDPLRYFFFLLQSFARLFSRQRNSSFLSVLARSTRSRSMPFRFRSRLNEFSPRFRATLGQENFPSLHTAAGSTVPSKINSALSDVCRRVPAAAAAVVLVFTPPSSRAALALSAATGIPCRCRKSVRIFQPASQHTWP